MLLSLLLGALALRLTDGAAAELITLSADDSLWVLHPDDVGIGARPPLQLALRDVQRDWYKVLGKPPKVVLSAKKGRAALPAGFEGTAIFVGKAAAPFGSLSTPEEHALLLDEVKGEPSIIAALGGGHVRGEVYALYAFSERVLGVEPLWWWTDTQPTFASGGTLTLPAASLPYESGVPVFKHRGIFPNDEDLLGGFTPDPLGQSTFSPDTWDRILEALLRLKGNLMIPSTASFPDEAVYAVAARRGVAVSQQHFTLLGVNTWRWPEGVPYSFDQNREMQDYVWKACVDTYAGRETVWTIGYRGLNDYAFWKDEPAFNTTEKRCALISEAMAAQASIVRQTAARSDDECVTYLWAEMLDLFLSGDLVIPPNTTRVFADAGGSGQFDDAVVAQLREGDGAYYHVQMESPGRLSQLTEMVPPASFFKALSPFVAKKATSLFMLNLSDLKPAVFMVDLVLRFLWQPAPYVSAPSPEHAQSAAIASWCERFFGAAFTDKAAALMEGYFGVEYIAALNSTRYGDQHLAYLPRELLSGAATPDDALAFVATPLAQLAPLHDAAVELLSQMRAAAAPGADFFEASLLLHLAIHRHGCDAVNATARAVAARDADGASARAAAAPLLRSAIASLESVFESQRAAEGLKWRGLYAADELDDFFEVSCVLRDALAREEARLSVVEAAVDEGEIERRLGTHPLGPPSCTLQTGALWQGGTGKWSTWFSYSNTSANFPLLNPSDRWTFNSVARVTCAEPCVNTPVGGNFENKTSVRMAAPCVDAGDAVIRYTLDGSEPAASSALFDGEVVLSATTAVAARVFGKHGANADCDGTLTTRPVFTRK